MILFKDFDKKNYDDLFDMMVDFYSSDAVDSLISEDVVKRLLDDILSGEYSVRGVELWFGDELVGFGVITSYYASEVAGVTIQLEDLFIREEYRSKGIGKAYFDHVKLKYPEALRFRLEVCSTNKKAIKLYKSMGFEKLEYEQMVFNIE